METDLGQGLPAFKDLVQEVKELEKRSSVSVRKKISFEELEQPLPQIQTEMEKIEFGALVAEVFKAEKAIASTYYDSQLNVPLDNISQVQKQITLKEATALLDKKRASAGLAAQKQQVSEPKKTLGQKKPEAVKEIEAGPKPQETNAQVLPPHDVAVPTQKGVGTAKAAQDARVAQKLPKQAQTPAQAIELLKKGILENIVASKVAKTGKGLALQGGQIEPGVLAKEEKRLGQITQAVSAG
ncbi:hypothetical protein FJZ26_03065, partial [Candidatus Parvarchaeota archaeon]|nr:hypothetical protein [Candidatus Parvarchaeota archaeon]